jgi:hypothetical protein
VRFIFRRYAELGSVRLLKDELDARSIRSKLRTSASGRLRGGNPFARGALYLMLQNRIYRRRSSTRSNHILVSTRPPGSASSVRQRKGRLFRAKTKLNCRDAVSH